jgi:non-homologous end joining protein Ku
MVSKSPTGYMQFFEDGTLIKKLFVNPSSGKLQFYEGQVKGFDVVEGYYKIIYDDGDREELSEDQVMMYLCG